MAHHAQQVGGTFVLVGARPGQVDQLARLDRAIVLEFDKGQLTRNLNGVIGENFGPVLLKKITYFCLTGIIFVA